MFMLTHLWRDGSFPRHLNRTRSVLNTTVEAAVIVTVIILTGTVLVRADDNEARRDQPDTEHLFGFVEGSDIGSKGDGELMTDSSVYAGKSSGTFADSATDFEINYTAFEHFRIATIATLAYYDVAGVSGIADVQRAALQSLAAEARFQLLDRTHAPVGLTLSVSPHWGFFDETSGVRSDHFGEEIQMLADRELVRDQLAGAVNLLFENDRVRLLASDGVEHESLLGAGAALSAQIFSDLWLGGETRYWRDYSGTALNIFSGQAVYVGPTVYTRLGQKAFVSAACEFQIWGSAIAAPGTLDLTNFGRYEVKFRLGVEF
jgi:hypothetical protein